MKRPPHQPSTKARTTAAAIFHGILPSRVDTVVSALLASLLEGNTVNGMDAVFEQSTTRAAAAVYDLKNDYGWHIERQMVAEGTKDGRVAWVMTYWLSREVLDAAFAAGAGPWIEKVKVASAKRRKQAHVSKAKASRLNAARVDPRQGDFWGKP